MKISCEEWLQNSDWIQIEVDVPVPEAYKPVITEEDKKRRVGSSFTESGSSGGEESGESSGGPDSPDERDTEQPVVLLGNPNKHLVGESTYNNAIKITVKDPEVRFLQLVTRYNINEEKRYDHLPDLSSVKSDLTYLKIKIYNTEKEISKLNDKSLTEEERFGGAKWAVDTIITDEETSTEGKIYSPYYDQPEHSGIFEVNDHEKILYDEPELWDLKIANSDGDEILCKDTVRFFTFIMKNCKVEGVVEWARVGRPVIMNRDGQSISWQELTQSEFQFFKKKQKEHTYRCQYKIYSVKKYNEPQELPEWVTKVLEKDAKDRTFDIHKMSNYAVRSHVSGIKK